MCYKELPQLLTPSIPTIAHICLDFFCLAQGVAHLKQSVLDNILVCCHRSGLRPHARSCLFQTLADVRCWEDYLHTSG